MQHVKRIDHMVHRRDQGLTYKRLGDEFDLSPQHVSRLIKNAPSRGGLTRTPFPCDYTGKKQTEEG